MTQQRDIVLNQGEERNVDLDIDYHPHHPISKGVIL